MGEVRNLPSSLTISLVALLLVNGVIGQTRVDVGLVVTSTEDLEGKKVLAALDIALSDFYFNHRNFTTRLQLNPRSSNADVLTSSSAVLELIKDVEVAAIIGPETSMEAQFEISICNKSHVPLITYSATSPFLSSLKSKYFIQATQVDSSQVDAIRSLVEAFGWRQIVPIYADNEFGGGIIPSLVDSLIQIGTHIPHRSPISSSASDDQISVELNNLKSLSTRVFIVHMDGWLGERLFTLAHKLGMVTRDYVWIVTNGIGNVIDLLKPKTIKEDMQGVIGVATYFPETAEFQNFVFRWKRRLVQENQDVVDPQVTVFILWAYDSISALARAVEKAVGSSGFAFDRSNTSLAPFSNDLSTFGVSRAGSKLVTELRKGRFLGLSGNFNLSNGQLNSSIMNIINIVGKGENTVGIWTPGKGFVRNIRSLSKHREYSTNKSILRPIIWPGGTKDVPKGWVLPTNEKKLRVLVPVKDGFDEFVKVHFDGTEPTGFCIELFKSIINSFPYPIPVEYVTINDTKNPSNHSYDELVTQLYWGKCDAVVGDVTILANRSMFVDFTLPYIESGVVMVAPIDTRKLDWVFVKPFAWDLWLASFCSLLFFALVLWVIEHTNPDLNSPNDTLFYTFSMLVFAHGHRLSNNMARVLVIVWLIFILIITQSYTANLASMLTVNQLESKVINITELKISNKTVGYQEGSFVKDFLKQNNITNVKPYSSPEQLHELLVNGSEKGGIAAAFDELPYIKVFLSKYCSKYMMVPPVYQAEGLGFAFPLGSPLVADVSRQILKLREGGKMDVIEKNLHQQGPCLDSSSGYIISSSSLKLDSFWELFSIVGSISLGGLILFLIRYYVNTPGGGGGGGGDGDGGGGGDGRGGGNGVSAVPVNGSPSTSS